MWREGILREKGGIERLGDEMHARRNVVESNVAIPRQRGLEVAKLPCWLYVV